MNSQLPSLAEQVRGLAAYAASLRGTAQSNSAARQSKHPAKLRAEAHRRGILQVLSAGAQLNARQLAAALSAAGHSVALGKVERSTTYPPADDLARAGLLARGRGGRGNAVIYSITAAGKQALTDARQPAATQTTPQGH